MFLTRCQTPTAQKVSWKAKGPFSLVGFSSGQPLLIRTELLPVGSEFRSFSEQYGITSHGREPGLHLVRSQAEAKRLAIQIGMDAKGMGWHLKGKLSSTCHINIHWHHWLIKATQSGAGCLARLCCFAWGSFGHHSRAVLLAVCHCSLLWDECKHAKWFY